MAKNVTLLGASYPDVPAVTLPQTGGGTATFCEISDTTATEEDVEAGKVFYKSNGQRAVGTMDTSIKLVAVTIPNFTIQDYEAGNNLDVSSYVPSGYTLYDASIQVDDGSSLYRLPWISADGKKNTYINRVSANGIIRITNNTSGWGTVPVYATLICKKTI